MLELVVDHSDQDAGSVEVFFAEVLEVVVVEELQFSQLSAVARPAKAATAATVNFILIMR